jgi:hypothetical protein
MSQPLLVGDEMKQADVPSHATASIVSVHDGSTVPLSSLWSTRTTMLVFLRHFL